MTASAARRAIAQAIDSGDAHHSQYNLKAIIDVVTTTGAFDITAMDRLALHAVVERHQLPLVNLVAITGPTIRARPGL